MTDSSLRRGLGLAGTLGTLLVASWPVAAQQPAAAPLPPGSPLIGRPDTDEAKARAGARPAAGGRSRQAAGRQAEASKGFKIESMPAACPTPARSRSATRARCSSARGSSTRSMPSSTRTASARSRWSRRASTGRTASPSRTARSTSPELSQISKIEGIEDKLDNPPKPTVIYNDLPKDEAHGWKYLAIGPDNKLYFEVGQPCNNCIPSDKHGQLRRINLDGSGAEVIARGVRNTVGFDWHPTSKEMYFTDNSRDWMSEELPNDELNRITRSGSTSARPFATRATCLIRNSAGAAPAASSSRRSR